MKMVEKLVKMNSNEIFGQQKGEDICHSSEDILKELELKKGIRENYGVGFVKSVPFHQTPPFYQAPSPPRNFSKYSK